MLLWELVLVQNPVGGPGGGAHIYGMQVQSRDLLMIKLFNMLKVITYL